MLGQIYLCFLIGAGPPWFSVVASGSSALALLPRQPTLCRIPPQGRLHSLRAVSGVSAPAGVNSSTKVTRA